jgi:hypothetical protein
MSIASLDIAFVVICVVSGTVTLVCGIRNVKRTSVQRKKSKALPWYHAKSYDDFMASDNERGVTATTLIQLYSGLTIITITILWFIFL